MKVIKLSSGAVKAAVAVLRKGGVVIFPTDTVYGFLADAKNKKAVAKIYAIKKRPKSKPLPVFVKDIAMAGDLAIIDEKAAKMLKKFWPGKYTFVLKIKSQKSKVKIYGTDGRTIALRIPKHKFLQNVLKKINRPLAQTSVNVSGSPSLSKISDIIKQFHKYDVLIVDARNLKKSKPSKIIDLVHNSILRK